jgi:hypothetical protein
MVGMVCDGSLSNKSDTSGDRNLRFLSPAPFLPFSRRARLNLGSSHQGVPGIYTVALFGLVVLIAERVIARDG